MVSRFSLELDNPPELVIAATLSSLTNGTKQKSERAKHQHHLASAASLTLRLLSALAGPAIRPARIPVRQGPRFLDLHLESSGDRVGPAFTPRNPAHIGGITSDLDGNTVVHSAIKRRQAIQMGVTVLIGVTVFISVTISPGD